MTTLRFDPPTPFNFKQCDEWYCWKQRFEHFRLVSALLSEGEEGQVCLFLYS